MSIREKGQRVRSPLARATFRPRPYSPHLRFGLVSTLLPGLRPRTRRRLHEWSWIGWFLVIGWWAVPTILITWVVWTIVKGTILFILWSIDTIKEVRGARSRSDGGSW